MTRIDVFLCKKHAAFIGQMVSVTVEMKKIVSLKLLFKKLDYPGPLTVIIDRNYKHLFFGSGEGDLDYYY